MSGKKDPALLKRIAILPGAPEYAQPMEELTGIVYGIDPRDDDKCLNADHYRHHLAVFPEGQFVAVDTETNQVVGLTLGMRTNRGPHNPMIAQWWDVIGQGWFTTHEPHGEWMYGVESAVHPDYRGAGVGSRLMDARFAVLKRLNLRGMIAGSAIIDYPKVADQMSPEAYLRDVVAGKRFDTNLSKQLHKGFKAAGLIPNYLPVEETGGWGVLIVWDNPDYRAVRRARYSAAPLVNRWRVTPAFG